MPEARVLASYLQQQGAGPDTFVGLCMARSLDMLVGVLGILKAGAAYVPLDPSLAEERMDHIVGDSGMGLLLTARNALLPAAGPAKRTIPH